VIPEFDLSGKRVVVSGLSYGIGRAIGLAFAEAGALVSGYYHGSTSTEATAADLRTAGAPDAWVERVDASDWDAVSAFADNVVGAFGGIDVWVNNAARLLVKPLLEMTPGDYRSLLALNLDGYFYGSRAAAQRMKDQGRGRIINVSSVVNMQPPQDLTAYVTAKGGVSAMTRAMAVDLACYGITVNSVSPGATETPLNAVAYTPEVRARYAQRIALARIATAREAALPVLFLASDAASYITGADLVCDGGITINGTVGHARTD
jgi:NAD(P)-dependent dehydrogenase (short-subunit alcohol dehydrogenase family)